MQTFIDHRNLDDTIFNSILEATQAIIASYGCESGLIDSSMDNEITKSPRLTPSGGPSNRSGENQR